MANNAVNLAQLFYRQKGRCYWCKCCTMTLEGGNDAHSATRDHIIPRSQGGKNWMKIRGKKRMNVVAACRRCNNGRGSMDAHVFRSTMRPHIQSGAQDA